MDANEEQKSNWVTKIQLERKCRLWFFGTNSYCNLSSTSSLNCAFNAWEMVGIQNGDWRQVGCCGSAPPLFFKRWNLIHRPRYSTRGSFVGPRIATPNFFCNRASPDKGSRSKDPECLVESVFNKRWNLVLYNMNTWLSKHMGNYEFHF